MTGLSEVLFTTFMIILKKKLIDFVQYIILIPSIVHSKNRDQAGIGTWLMKDQQGGKTRENSGNSFLILIMNPCALKNAN